MARWVARAARTARAAVVSGLGSLRVLGLEQVEAPALRDRLPPAGDSELAVDRAEMRLDRVDRQEQRFRYLLVGHVRGQEPQHRQFTLGKCGPRRLTEPPWQPAVEPVEDPAGEPGGRTGGRDHDRERGPD